jgi:hypothetical protein
MGMRSLRPATWFLKSWDLIPRSWDLNVVCHCGEGVERSAESRS